MCLKEDKHNNNIKNITFLLIMFLLMKNIITNHEIGNKINDIRIDEKQEQQTERVGILDKNNITKCD